MNFDPVSAVMAWISVYGLIGLLDVALAERFVPVLPSYGLLLAVGIGAADGVWSLSTAFLATATGNLSRCAVWFYAVRRLGDARSAHLLDTVGRRFGMSADRDKNGITSFRRSQTALAFALQLVPTVKRFVPAFAALLRGNARFFLTASAAGIAVWSGLFISIGFYASHSIETTNTAILADAVLSCLLIVEITLFSMARRFRARRALEDVTCEI